MNYFHFKLSVDEICLANFIPPANGANLGSFLCLRSSILIAGHKTNKSTEIIRSKFVTGLALWLRESVTWLSLGDKNYVHLYQFKLKSLLIIIMH